MVYSIILWLRFDIIKEKRLISSYDEINDTFAGKIDGEHGYCKDYGISNGVYLGINNQHFPSYILVSNASEVFNISKQVLENPNVKIHISCNGMFLYFSICIEDLMIFSTECENKFGIPFLDFVFDSNY